MTSITQQKADLRATIMRRIEHHVEQADAEQVKNLAINATRQLAHRLPLCELKAWDEKLQREAGR